MDNSELLAYHDPSSSLFIRHLHLTFFGKNERGVSDLDYDQVAKVVLFFASTELYHG